MSCLKCVGQTSSPKRTQCPCPVCATRSRQGDLDNLATPSPAASLTAQQGKQPPSIGETRPRQEMQPLRPASQTAGGTSWAPATGHWAPPAQGSPVSWKGSPRLVSPLQDLGWSLGPRDPEFSGKEGGRGGGMAGLGLSTGGQSPRVRDRTEEAVPPWETPSPSLRLRFFPGRGKNKHPSPGAGVGISCNNCC